MSLYCRLLALAPLDACEAFWKQTTTKTVAGEEAA